MRTKRDLDVLEERLRNEMQLQMANLRSAMLRERWLFLFSLITALGAFTAIINALG